MKNLHVPSEEKWVFTSYASLEGVIRRPESPREVILLLHGLGERGKRIFRKLCAHLPEQALIIAPSAPFLVPRPKAARVEFGHSWYFFDKTEGKYFINQDLAKYWLRDLLLIENPGKLPVTIIGFSQGGYLAPLVGQEVPETRLILGIACEFRTSLIHEKLPFSLVAIHGNADEIVSLTSAKAESEKLRTLGNEVDFRVIDGLGHEITSEVGAEIKAILESYGKRSLQR